MGLQLGHPLLEIPRLPVSRQRDCHLIPADLIQAAQIIPQGILHLRPVGDIGGNVEQHMVSQDHGSGPLQEKAHLPRRMSRRLDGPQAVSSGLEHIPLIQRRIIVKIHPSRHRPGRRLGEHLLDHPKWNAMAEQVFLLYLVELLGLVRPHRPLQIADIGPSQIHLPAGPDQIRRVPRMVRVEMGQQDICIFHRDAQLPQAFLHRRFTYLRAETGVDQKVPFSPDHITVQFL